MINLVDVNRVWFKSNYGFGDACCSERDDTICTYTILDETPDVYVVPDTTKDERFAKNIFVHGPPFLKFYAGAALVINGYKIGTFCVFDTKLHPEFDMECKQNLLDLGACISQLIAERRNDYLEIERQKAMLVVAATQSIKIPITLAKSTLSLFKDMACSGLLKALPNLVRSQADEFSDSVRNLVNLVELVLSAVANAARREECTSVFSLDLSKEMKFLCREKSDNVIVAMKNLAVKLQACLPKNKIVIEFANGSTNCTSYSSYLDAIKLLICSVIGHSHGQWKLIRFTITYKDKLQEELLTENGTEKGWLSLAIEYSSPLMDGDLSKSQIVANNLRAMIVKNILSVIGGKCVVDMTEEQLFLIPCDAKKKKELTSMTLDFFQSLIPAIISAGNTRESTTKIDSFIEENRSSGMDSFATVAYDDLDQMIQSNKLKKPSTNYQLNDIVPSMFSSGSDKIHTFSEAISSMNADHVQADKDLVVDKELHVLVIEDTISVQKILAKYLTKNSCKVECAENGLIGLNLMKQKKFDLVITDFLMVSSLSCLEKTNSLVSLFIH